MTGSLRTHVNGAISIWSYRVTLSPLLRSAKRPAWIEFYRTPWLLKPRRARRLIHCLPPEPSAYTKCAKLYPHRRRRSSGTPWVTSENRTLFVDASGWDEIVVVRSSVFSKPYSSIARHVTKYWTPQGVVRETNRKPVRDGPGALGWREVRNVRWAAYE